MKFGLSAAEAASVMPKARAAKVNFLNVAVMEKMGKRATTENTEHTEGDCQDLKFRVFSVFHGCSSGLSVENEALFRTGMREADLGGVADAFRGLILGD